MHRITNARDLDGAWLSLRASLARWLAISFPATTRSVLEVGCGSGQITVPLSESLPEAAITAVDQFEGPYSRDRPSLLAAFKRAGARRRVRVVKANSLQWIPRQKPDRFDVVLSSEFLPEIDASQLQSFFNACFRVLRPGGVTAHLFLSPNPAKPRRKLVVEADSDPRWTRHPPREWFSPPASLVLQDLTAAGFCNNRTRRHPGGLVARGEAARSLLRQWGVRTAFAKTYADRLSKGGLELPDWIVTRGTKPE